MPDHEAALLQLADELRPAAALGIGPANRRDHRALGPLLRRLDALDLPVELPALLLPPGGAPPIPARSPLQRAVLGTTPRYEEGDVVAMTERGHAYRINAETIAMTATNTHDHVQNVKERLASIEPQEVMSLSQAQEVVTQNANERGSIPIDRFEEVPSAWEIGRSAERAAGSMEQVAGGVAGGIAKGLESFALGFEAYFFGASRQAPGGAEYETPAAAGPPPPVVEKPAWLQEKDKLRTTSGVEATQDAGVKAKVEEKQGQSHAELWAEMRRANEKVARERAELYRDRDDDGDRDRER